MHFFYDLTVFQAGLLSHNQHRSFALHASNEIPDEHALALDGEDIKVTESELLH